MNKIYMKTLALSLISILLLSGCSQPADKISSDENKDSVVVVEELILTTEELSKYDGQDGKSAYIAVDGVIYDVTNVEFWNGGSHNGYAAGLDLTEEIKNVSPHGVVKLQGLPVIGKLKD